MGQLQHAHGLRVQDRRSTMGEGQVAFIGRSENEGDLEQELFRQSQDKFTHGGWRKRDREVEWMCALVDHHCVYLGMYSRLK